MKKLLLIIALLTAILQIQAQTITDVTFRKAGSKVTIFYNLKGKLFSKWSVSVYLSQDGGNTWGKPLQHLSGEVGNGITSGENKRVIWDIQDEKLKPDSSMVFKIETNRYKGPETYKPYSQAYYRYKKSKALWFISAAGFGAAGIYLRNQSASLYNQYQSATLKAPALHQEIERNDKLYPIAFGVSGFSALTCIFKIYQQGKEKKRPLSFEPISNYDGGGIRMVYKF